MFTGNNVTPTEKATEHGRLWKIWIWDFLAKRIHFAARTSLLLALALFQIWTSKSFLQKTKICLLTGGTCTIEERERQSGFSKKDMRKTTKRHNTMLFPLKWDKIRPFYWIDNLQNFAGYPAKNCRCICICFADKKTFPSYLNQIRWKGGRKPYGKIGKSIFDWP